VLGGFRGGVNVARVLTTIVGATAPLPLIYPNLALVYRDRVAALHEALGDTASRAEAFDAIRSLIDEIRLVPDNGVSRIDLRGELAGILSIAANSNKPAGLSTDGLAEQIKMAAEAGNHRQLTLRCPV